MIGSKSAEDRGSADSYYRRGAHPHKVVDGVEVPLAKDTPEWQEYMKAYYDNERAGDFKQW